MLVSKTSVDVCLFQADWQCTVLHTGYAQLVIELDWTTLCFTELLLIVLKLAMKCFDMCVHQSKHSKMKIKAIHRFNPFVFLESSASSRLERCTRATVKCTPH